MLVAHRGGARLAPENTLPAFRQGIDDWGADMIELDVAGGRLHLEVSDEELARRRAAWRPPAPPERGYAKMFHDHVMQADSGCDFDFLVGSSGAPVPRESH